jgi:hypothetical protein
MDEHDPNGAAVPKLFQHSQLTAADILRQPHAAASPMHPHVAPQQQLQQLHQQGMVAYDAQGGEHSLVSVVPTPRGLMIVPSTAPSFAGQYNPAVQQQQQQQSFIAYDAQGGEHALVSVVPTPRGMMVAQPAAPSFVGQHQQHLSYFPPTQQQQQQVHEQPSTARPVGLVPTMSSVQLVQMPTGGGTAGVYVQQSQQQGGVLVHRSSNGPGGAVSAQQHQQRPQGGLLVTRPSFGPGASESTTPPGAHSLQPALFRPASLAQMPAANHHVPAAASHTPVASPPSHLRPIRVPGGAPSIHTPGGLPISPSPTPRASMQHRMSSSVPSKTPIPRNHRTSAAIANAELREEVAMGLAVPGPRRPVIPGMMGAAY